MANKCYFRFKEDYNAAQQGQNNKGPTANMAQTSSQSRNNADNTTDDANKSDDINTEEWFPDSGATNHMTNNLQNLNLGNMSYTGKHSVAMGNGETINISHIETCTIEGTRSLYLNNLLRVPSIKKNLISVSQFAKENNVYFEFHPGFCLVRDLLNKNILLQGKLDQGLYKFSNMRKRSFCNNLEWCNNVSTNNDKDVNILDAWHCKLGHSSSDVVKQVLNENKISFPKLCSSNICTHCQIGKSHKLPFQYSETAYEKPLELVAADLWGPSPHISTQGDKYYLSLVDAHSRYTWIYFLKAKSDTCSTVKHFITCIEKQLNSSVKMIQTDGVGEFKSLKDFFTTKGILHRMTCPHTSEQNELVERKYRHIVETGLTLMSQVSLPMRYWRRHLPLQCISSIECQPKC